MAGNSLGTAYVQVVPKLEKGSLDGMGKQLSGMLGNLAKLAAVAVLAKGIRDLGEAALDSYADFEQLVGGVETLYKDSADLLIANAKRAYVTAGLSANEYMEMSTSFAAALVNSLGGNTAEAARLADVAITDMSDNANKMGTDMEAIQNAYQGFAKQNYTMLDNLKLGYGGTKTEMERLLADAERISGIHYDIESYSDVVNAIHVIQTEMGIAGTTALEAASTISGSWGMLEGAWQNLLTSIAGGGDEIDVAVKAVFDSLMTWFGNVAPRILEIARGIFAAIPAVIAEAMPVVRDTFLGFIRDAFGSDAADAVLDFINVLHGMVERAKAFFSDLMAAAQPLVDFLTGKGEAFGSMMERIQGHLSDLAPHIENIKAVWEQFKDAVVDLVEVAAPIVAEFFGNLISGVVGLVPYITLIAGTFLDVATKVIEAVTWLLGEITTGFEGIRTAAAEKWDAIKTAVTDTVENIRTAVSEKWTAISTIVSDTLGTIKSTVGTAWENIKTAASSAWDAVKSTISNAINGARDAVGNAIAAIKGFFNFEFRWPHIPLPHFSITGSVNPIDWLTSGLPQIGISWYGHGGMYDQPTVMLPGVGERGAELVWPSYEPELSKYAAAIASRIDRSGSRTYIFNAREINSDRMLRQAVDQAALTAARRAGML